MSTFRARIAHLESMKDLKPGERVESSADAPDPMSPSAASGVTVRRCKVRRDGWIVKWDNGHEGRIATVNIRRAPVTCDCPEWDRSPAIHEGQRYCQACDSDLPQDVL